MTVAQDPVLIMLDEPTAGLNSEESRNAVQLIRQVTEGRTLVMVEHDMDVVFDLADRITVLNDGTILASGCAGGDQGKRRSKEGLSGEENRCC